MIYRHKKLQSEYTTLGNELVNGDTYYDIRAKFVEDLATAMSDLKKKDPELFKKACLMNAIKNKVVINGIDITDILFNGICENLFDGDKKSEIPPYLNNLFEIYKNGLLKDVDAYFDLIVSLEISDDLRKDVVLIIENKVKYTVLSDSVEVEITKDDTFDDLIEKLAKYPAIEITPVEDASVNVIKHLEGERITKQVYYNYKNNQDIEFSKIFFFNICIYLGLEINFVETFLLQHGLSIKESKMSLDKTYRYIFEYGLDKELSELYLILIGYRKKDVARNIDIKKNYFGLINANRDKDEDALHTANIHYCVKKLDKAIETLKSSLSKKYNSFLKHEHNYNEKPTSTNLALLTKAEKSLQRVKDKMLMSGIDVFGKTVEGTKWEKELSFGELEEIREELLSKLHNLKH